MPEAGPNGNGDADADSNVGADRDQLAGLHLGCQQWPCRRRQPWLFSESASQCAAGFRDIEGAVGACPMGSRGLGGHRRSAEQTSELQSLMRISYAVF